MIDSRRPLNCLSRSAEYGFFLLTSGLPVIPSTLLLIASLRSSTDSRETLSNLEEGRLVKEVRSLVCRWEEPIPFKEASVDDVLSTSSRPLTAIPLEDSLFFSYIVLSSSLL